MRCSIGLLVMIGAVLAILTFSVFMQVGNHEFLSFDDDVYVTSNPHVAAGMTGENVLWAFTSTDTAGYWHPITWLSHMEDVQLFGMNPRGHHLTNVILHTASTLLLFLFLFRCTRSPWQSSFVAALFALHPLHVESVAWVAERKDVLSAFFWLLTLVLYCAYVAKPKPARYLVSLALFVLGLMSKPMLVTLPVILLLVDFWPLDRYRDAATGKVLRDRVVALTIEKIPFFACSLIAGIAVISTQHKAGAMSALHARSFPLRLENSLTGYLKYIGKALWPHDLALLYPLGSSYPLWQVTGSLLVLILVSAAVIWVGRRHRYLAVGWFWFLITLAPAIGLIQVGVQSMADRFSYIPLIGLCIMAAWGVPELTRSLKYREGILALAASGVVIVCSVLTWQQLGYWRDNISIYRHTLQITTDNYLIHNNLGLALVSKGDLDGGIQNYQEALRIRPDYTLALNNLGLALFEKGDLDAAIQNYQKALGLEPGFTAAMNNLGRALASKGDLDGAIKKYQEALSIDPNFRGAHNNLGLALTRKGELDAAITHYRESLGIEPNHPDTHTFLGSALAAKGDLNEAIREYQEALRIEPTYLEAEIFLGMARAGKGDLDGAILSFQQVLRLNPKHAQAQNFLQLALAQKRNQEQGRR